MLPRCFSQIDRLSSINYFTAWDAHGAIWSPFCYTLAFSLMIVYLHVLVDNIYLYSYPKRKIYNNDTCS